MTSTLTEPTGRVHWLGTGLSTGSGLALVCATATGTTVWGRSREKAQACLDRLGLTGQADARELGWEALADAVRPGDLVVSMLPAAEHPTVLRLCLRQSAHFASSSYVSAEVAELAADARRAGLVVLTDAGLDPGIDHLLAHRLVQAAEKALGDTPATVSFTSYCGSFPAVPNDFRYRFSWAPRGVLTALGTPARFVEGGRELTVDRPYRAAEKLVLGGEPFEVYANRDSIPYITTYQFPKSWEVDTFVRGTVRLDGWTDAWQPVFAQLENGTADEITALAARLAEQYPATSEDHDRVVMFVRLEAVTGDGARWAGEYTMDVQGDATENATPRLVSVALAGGLAELLAGRMSPGLHQATSDPGSIDSWLDFLSANGVACQEYLP
ncbi:saccharopine dehydrogenase family protein [Micromonospora sp. NPDC053740]|uniref:saccharopine dehydrogenase family protein n=1 Tax=Micromonospora sp. NPDC053740 TaxID=3155173 RepID=UPI00342C33A1